jgi:hypothetical protein
MVVALKELWHLVSISPLDGASLGHSVVESVMVELETIVVALVVSEVLLGVHLLFRGLPLTHISSTDHPRNDDSREPHQKGAEKSPRLQISLEHVQVTDSLRVIREVEMVLWQDLDEFVGTTTRSDWTGK